VGGGPRPDGAIGAQLRDMMAATGAIRLVPLEVTRRPDPTSRYRMKSLRGCHCAGGYSPGPGRRIPALTS